MSYGWSPRAASHKSRGAAHGAWDLRWEPPAVEAGARSCLRSPRVHDALSIHIDKTDTACAFVSVRLYAVLGSPLVM
jgi:hypothetical protein